jgi:hypothetical protein
VIWDRGNSLMVPESEVLVGVMLMFETALLPLWKWPQSKFRTSSLPPWPCS